MLIFSFLLVLVAAMLGFWAQNRVVRQVRRFSEIPNLAGSSGAEAADGLLRRAGVTDVKIERIERGFLRDHYDPRRRVLRLSPQVHDGRNVAALGVAAHEVGHALQDAFRFAPLRMRNLVVPTAQLGNAIGLPMLLLGAILRSPPLALLGAMFYLGVVVLQLLNLPVELDASRRGLEALDETRLVRTPEEAHGAAAVLNAAAMTYLAAALAGLATLTYYLILVFGGRRN